MSDLKWEGPVRYSDAERIRNLYGVPGVYVYIVTTDKFDTGIVNVYGGKADRLGWRIVEHAVATLGLMNELYAGDGSLIFPTSSKGHFDERLRELAAIAIKPEHDALGTFARNQLNRMEFWYVPVDDAATRRGLEGSTVQHLRQRTKATAANSSASKVNCLTRRAPSDRVQIEVALPDDSAGMWLRKVWGPLPSDNAERG